MHYTGVCVCACMCSFTSIYFVQYVYCGVRLCVFDVFVNACLRVSVFVPRQWTRESALLSSSVLRG